MSPKAIRGKRRKSTAKTTVKAPPKTVAKIAQPHGGALNAGGTPGNPGNPSAPGRPPSAIRERCRGSYDDRIRILEEIADGEPTERIQVPLLSVLAHVHCPKCESKLKVNDPLEALTTTITVKASARAKERIQAISEIGKTGMTTSRLDVEEVRARLLQTIGIVRAELPPADAERVIDRLKPVWAA